jgi:hypothetical protein
MDDSPDPIIVSRVLGIILVFGYLWVIREPISSLGLHSKNIDKAFIIGVLPLMIVYLVICYDGRGPGSGEALKPPNA